MLAAVRFRVVSPFEAIQPCIDGPPFLTVPVGSIIETDEESEALDSQRFDGITSRCWHVCAISRNARSRWMNRRVHDGRFRSLNTPLHQTKVVSAVHTMPRLRSVGGSWAQTWQSF
jgi:hypothetical protein